MRHRVQNLDFKPAEVARLGARERSSTQRPAAKLLQELRGLPRVAPHRLAEAERRLRCLQALWVGEKRVGYRDRVRVMREVAVKLRRAHPDWYVSRSALAAWENRLRVGGAAGLLDLRRGPRRHGRPFDQNTWAFPAGQLSEMLAEVRRLATNLREILVAADGLLSSVKHASPDTDKPARPVSRGEG